MNPQFAWITLIMFVSVVAYAITSAAIGQQSVMALAILVGGVLALGLAWAGFRRILLRTPHVSAGADKNNES